MPWWMENRYRVNAPAVREFNGQYLTQTQQYNLTQDSQFVYYNPPQRDTKVQKRDEFFAFLRHPMARNLKELVVESNNFLELHTLFDVTVTTSSHFIIYGPYGPVTIRPLRPNITSEDFDRYLEEVNEACP